MVDLWSILDSLPKGVTAGIGAGLTRMSGGGTTRPRARTTTRIAQGTPRATGRVSSSRYPKIPTQGFSAPAQPNPLEQLLQAMQSMVGQGMGMGTSYQPDLENLMGQITGAVDPVYDARRAAIEQLMGRATERTTAGRADVTGMYEALARDYGTQAGVAEQQMEEAQAEAAALQGQLKKNIQGTYSRIQEEQADLFSDLGIEAAAPEVLGAQAEDQAFQETQAAQMGTLSEDYYNQLGAADQAYYTQGAPLARLEGTNRSADLLAALQDYMAQSEAGITELEGQRTGDIMSAYNQLAMQAQQFAQQQTQQSQGNQWGQMQDLFGNLMQMGYGPQEQAPGLTTSALGIAEQLGLDPNEAQQMQSMIGELGRNPALLYGESINPETGKPVKTTGTQVQQMIGSLAVSQRVKQALSVWAEQAFGAR